MCLFLFLFCFGFPTREFFTHIETSPLLGKGCKILTYSRHPWSLRSATPFVTRGIRLNGHLQGTATPTPGAECCCHNNHLFQVVCSINGGLSLDNQKSKQVPLANCRLNIIGYFRYNRETIEEALYFNIYSFIFDGFSSILA